MHTLSSGISTEYVVRRLADALQRKWGVFRSPAKQLARLVGGADPRACKNWLEGRNAPHLAQALELMAADPEIEEAILAIVRGRRAEMEKTPCPSFATSGGSASASTGHPSTASASR